MGYLRNFVRQIKIVRKRDYFIINSKMGVLQEIPKHGYVDDDLETLIYLVAGADLNQRPSGYEPDELPDCSTPR